MIIYFVKELDTQVNMSRLVRINILYNSDIKKEDKCKKFKTAQNGLYTNNGKLNNFLFNGMMHLQQSSYSMYTVQGIYVSKGRA